LGDHFLQLGVTDVLAALKRLMDGALYGAVGDNWRIGELQTIHSPVAPHANLAGSS